MIKYILSYPEIVLSKIERTKFFKRIVSSPLNAALTLVIIVLFWSFPSYDVPIFLHQFDRHWATIFLQVKEPFVNHNYLYEYGSHAEKLAFRFVPAVILNILHIDSLIPALIFQFFTMVFFYYMLILAFNKLFQDRNKAFVFALPICFVIAGHVYISDYTAKFDTLALAFCLMAFLFRNKIYVIIPLLLAYFTDERALIASPAIFLINLLEKNSFENIKSIFNGGLFVSNIYLFISWTIYFIVRYFLGIVFGLTCGTGGINLFFEQINSTVHTVYVGLEGFIIPFVLVAISLFKKRIYSFTILFILSFLLIFYVAQSVLDINRSMSYVILILILILMLFDKLYSKETVYKILAWVIVINILYDEAYPFLAQLYRMKFITHSI